MHQDDEKLLNDFHQRAIEAGEFGHRNHVRVAYLLLREHGLEAAIPIVREGLNALLVKFGLEDKLEQGYHETATIAYLKLINGIMARDEVEQDGGHESSAAFWDAHEELWQKRVLRLFYSKERLMSWEAKKAFVEPDLTPLPPLGKSVSS